MLDFFTDMTQPGMSFLINAFLTGILASVAFGVVGTYVVVRKISYLAGAVAHATLGGIGIALYLRTVHGVAWLSPMLGAVIASVVVAVVIGLISLYAKEREDTVIGVIWALGMSTGLLFLAKTPGYVDPMSYLFGNILLISRQDVLAVLVLDLCILSIVLLFYRKFLAVCLDSLFAEIRGVHVHMFYILLLVMTALTTVLLVSTVGIVMVIALLTIPAAIAGMFSHKLWRIMLVAVLLCALFNTLGLAVSYKTDLPSGPIIIVVTSVGYFLATIFRRAFLSKVTA